MSKKKQKSELLTPLELKVMNILWRLKKAFVKDIIAEWPLEDGEKTPAYNTVSTIIRILQDKKDFVGHDSEGRSHRYFPTVSKTKYQQRLLKNVVENVFAGSTTGLVSSLLDTEKLNNKEIAELKELIENTKEE